MPVTEVKKTLGAKSPVGGRAHFDEIFRTYEAEIYRYCYRLCRGNHSDAEDLAQDTWLLVWHSLHQFEGRSSIKAWLYQIALRRWMQIRNVGRESVPLDGVKAAVEPGQQDLRLCLDAAIGRLSEAQREAFILVKAEGLTHKEAAAVLGIPQGTVQFRVHEAIRKLRIELAAFASLLAALPVGDFDEMVRGWLAEPPSPGFAARVRAALDPAPVREGAAAAEGTAHGSVPRVSARSRMGKPAAAAGAVLILVGMATLLTARRRPGASASPPIASMLRSLQAVQSAHATGFCEQVAGGNGTLRSTTRYQVDAWFKSPARYRRRMVPQRGASGIAQDEYLDGGRGVVAFVTRLGRLTTLPIEAGDPGALSVFTRDDEVIRRLRSSNASISSVQRESTNGEALRIEVSAESTGRPHYWVFFIDSRTHRPYRLEHRQDELQREGWITTRRIVLDRVEYDLEVPDSLFRMPVAAR